MRVNMKVKLSDSDLIFLGGAAILGSMMREARSEKEVKEFAVDALRLSTDLLDLWRDIQKAPREYAVRLRKEVARKRRARKAKKR